MKNNTERIFVYVGLVVLLAYGGFLFWQNNRLQNEIEKTTSELEQTKTNLLQTEADKTLLSTNLDQEKTKNDSFKQQVDEITTTVGALEKLSKTDKELLQKYSKVYFLSENYVPSHLLNIDAKYIYDTNKELQFHANALSYLEKMLDEASSTNLNLKIVSAYRSFGTQTTLKSAYRFTYGAGSNKFSADQGYSEHQLGTAVDLTTSKIGAAFTGFENTSEYTWLTKNAYRFGFVLSYPPKNSYYIFEPWHWRFVGVKLAERLHEENQYFYDMTQRAIDAYLINIFD